MLFSGKTVERFLHHLSERQPSQDNASRREGGSDASGSPYLLKL